MTVTTPSKARSITIPKAPVLRAEDRKEGVRILMSLQTVEAALRMDDATAVRMIASKVVKEEQHHREFNPFIRKVAGFEYPVQRAVVEELLLDCFGRTG
ncbi:MAG TPA: hypothetical protein VIM37_01345 [Candidatus Microsaccharimonas sp.]|jgi:hypothetical protein